MATRKSQIPQSFNFQVLEEELFQNNKKMNPIEFITSKVGLGVKLFPQQKFIIKLFYGLKMDNTIKDIKIYDMFKEKLIGDFTEQAFLEYLVDTKKVNHNIFDSLVEEKDYDFENSPFTTLQLMCGRRGTKSSMTAFIVLYELYKILFQYNPQDYYGIIGDDAIFILSMASSGEVANDLFIRVQNLVANSMFFKKYLRDQDTKTTELGFITQTQIDKLKNGSVEKARPTVIFKTLKTSAKSAVSRNAPVVILDEFAYFNSELKSGKSTNISDSTIYDALVPSTSGFTYPNGRPAGRIFILSSPFGKDNYFYKLMEDAYENKPKGILAFRLPSWELNPKISGDFLKTEYRKDPTQFMQTYGATPLATDSNFIMSEMKYRNNVTMNRGNSKHGIVTKKYYMGVDIGAINHSSGFCVSHYDQSEKKIIVDYISSISPRDYIGNGEIVDTNMVVDAIIDELIKIYGKFNIVKSYFDQFNFYFLKYAVEKAGIKNIELMWASDQSNTEMYKVFLSLMMDESMDIPDLEPLHKQMYALKRRDTNRGNMSVGNDDFGDDMADALFRSVFASFRESGLTLENLQDKPKRSIISRGQSYATPNTSVGGVNIAGGNVVTNMIPGRIDQALLNKQTNKLMGQLGFARRR